MEVGDWVTLAAVIVALGIGVSSLIQTQRLQKRERKERLLNEIIEWAKDIVESGIISEISDIVISKDAKNKDISVPEWAMSVASRIEDRFKGNIANSSYIITITLSFSEELKNAVLETNKQLYKYEELLDQIAEGKTRLFPKAARVREKLDRAAIAVMEKAAKIKTKDIS